ncbi:poly-gamma-glutamate biosynthesis protein [Thioalkalivibrio denitrificans]|uniref:Poly-gamma-glutamate biosynthesis protein n=2 Tax=Thioalkalivibrio denitrificans TaxID=108003 RepID=A0A1V3NNB0_9GAMM|nr:poly-gamma-glutamate biosynthesis protein [Thioalkalivibrio denitrificans]
MGHARGASGAVTLFVCGDVMTGRGIDQALPHPCSPELYESYVHDARDYVSLAEAANGAIPRPVEFPYIWGAALEELTRFAPEVRLVNLETAITRHDAPWPTKGINYRMHPDNAPCLKAAGINCCALANNHVLDWGREGLDDTCRVLDRLGIARCGAGQDESEAMRPACLEPVPGNRVLVWSIGSTDSGIPADWAAGPKRPGVWLARKASARGAEVLAERIGAEKRPGDLAVVSIHWGGNWGYRIPNGHRAFARRLVEAGADLIHGHSSHHPRGMELYRGRPILYGCGDFINDYEGIGGHEEFRPELTLMYFLRFAPGTDAPPEMWMTPLRMARFSLHRADADDTRWLLDLLNRESHRDMPRFSLDAEGRLFVRLPH